MQGGSNRVGKGTKKLRGTQERRKKAAQVFPEPPGNVGPPPEHYTDAQKRSWAELAPAVAGVFTETDRPAFRQLVKLHARIEEPETEPPAYVYAQLVGRLFVLLDKFGCTPRSRQTVEPGGGATAPRSGAPADADEDFLFNRKPKLKAVT